MLFTCFFAATVLATAANAQSSTVAPSTTVSQVMPPVATQAFNPAAVNNTVRLSWCRGQTNNCRDICGGFASENSCVIESLTYSCVCQNGTVPDVTAFIETLPFYECQATFGQCIAAHPNDQAAQDVCIANQQCGTRNATAESIAANSATASSTTSRTSSSASGSGAANTGGSSSSSSSGFAAHSNEVGTGLFAVVMMAAFRLVL